MTPDGFGLSSGAGEANGVHQRGGGGGQPPTQMNADEIQSMFARRMIALFQHDATAFASDYADDCVLESPTFGVVVGREAIEKVFTAWFRTFPDAAFEQVDLVIEGTRVVHMTTISGTDTGGFLGQPATGKQYRFFIVFLVRLDGTHIVHERRVYDMGGLLLQLASRESSHRADGWDLLESRSDPEPTAVAATIYSTALKRARLEQDLVIAAEIQQALLPGAYHRGACFEVAATSLPCRAIGGDFFDYFDLPGGAFAFALGDVTGKGSPAALLAAELQGVIAAHADQRISASDLVKRANRVLARRPVGSRFVTMLYGVLSAHGRLTYCNAGHNPPFLVSGENVRRLDKGGMILGAFLDASFDEETIQLKTGDALVVFSDGITEAVDSEGAEFGDERLLSCIQANRDLAATELLTCVKDAVSTFCGGVSQSDDLTVLVLRYGL